ncbi:recombinase family protein [Pseudomonas sp. WS 5086]|jgi:DNA invertase Pin-like site-specific DNA recombinase|uniref:recombinase family protein n=1 Tax=Pseudomonas TaxID=286 RepID=UPI001473A94A|nr:recombinase family protein [Pseudomonas sp. WS 5086]NMX94562.1 recombinase family protein [Pseudomonas sp. WS 5086]
MVYAHLYLRASTKEQDANRARLALMDFAMQRGYSVLGVYADNFTGTKLERPELHRLLTCAEPGQILCVESVDRLSRLSRADWEILKGTINEKGLRLVVADLPTSWESSNHRTDEQGDIAVSIMHVINNMLIDLMATMARLDQEKRVARIKEGIANKRAADPSWKAQGKSKNVEKWGIVEKLLKGQPASRMTIREIAQAANVGEATVYRIKHGLGSSLLAPACD